MNYMEALNYIENTGKFGINLGLQRIERLCELLGNPERNLKVIHVGGTNGKGSTTTFISSILMSEGYKVGIYTSPYIERFTERIKINNEEITEHKVALMIEEIKPQIDKLVKEGHEHPTEFEIITACAFKYFSDNNVDFVVLEVGLGGRYDATNVVDPILSVITTISYDHMNILGDTLGKIAYEKAGIIKKDRPVVIYPQQEEAMEVLGEAAVKMNSPVYFTSTTEYEIKSDNVNGITFNAYGMEEYKNIKIHLLGEHQVMNALTALRAIEVLKIQGYKIDMKSILDGFEKAEWPGRFEILRRTPYIVLDGGHNIQGINALKEAVMQYFAGKTIKIVCGMLRDKNYNDMVNTLCEISDNFITVTPNNPRALSSDELKDVFIQKGKYAVSTVSIDDAVAKGLDNLNQFC